MIFEFKEFSVNQDKTAMKIGTDAVLLAAWTKVDKPIQSILDIGSGTGVIALQMAQMYAAETIDAVELNPDAYEQTVENFENSPWADRLFCYHAYFQEFVEEIDDTYDLIISNPPFYTEDYKSTDTNRNQARNTESLSFTELLSGVAKLLDSKGLFSVIIPYKEEKNFIRIAKKNNLFPNKITRVKGTENSSIKRSMLLFSFEQSKPIENQLIIEIKRHQYTKEYTDLVKDFYLKM